MKTPKLSKKEQEIARWIEKVSSLKQEVHTKKQEILTLESALKQFEAQYDIFVQTLQRQRQDLVERVQRCRLLIQDWGQPEAPHQLQETQNQPPEPEPEPEPKPALEPEPQPQEPIEIPLITERIRPSDSASQQKRKRAYHFFACFWHPDTAKQWSEACPDLHLTHQLHTAYGESQDLVDLLIGIPWHAVWLKRGKDEEIDLQLGRLIDWTEALEKASGRLDQSLADLQRHEFYPLLVEKQTADECGEDFFAQLASQERDEINRLENTLAILQDQLDELEQREAKEQGS
jgi:DNA anti-recombination protein RmuC